MTAALAITPAILLDDLRHSRRVADAEEARVLEIAVMWAHAHPVLDDTTKAWRIGGEGAVPLAEFDATALTLDVTDPEDEEALGWCGIPPVAWDAPAAFAAANGMSTGAGKCLIRDALILRHRLPKIWARMMAGDVQAWRARRIAQAVLGAPVDVVDYIDDTLAPVAGTIGTRALDRALEAAMLLLHAEALELDHACAEDDHHVTLNDPQLDGTADLQVRGDWKDLHDFDQAVGRVAAALKAAGDDRPLDARRARALGVLADPAQALALLNGETAPAPGKQVVLHLHLSDYAVLGLDPVGGNDTTRHAMLVEQIYTWLGRSDTAVVVKPVLDLNADLHTPAYAIPDRIREQVILTHPTCVFPDCVKPSRNCDLDHIRPWSAEPGGGQTTSANLAPLCRHHHRLKTHAGWTYRRLEPRVFLWTDPHGRRYLRDGATTRPAATT